jgi:hypothetical protein
MGQDAHGDRFVAGCVPVLHNEELTSDLRPLTADIPFQFSPDNFTIQNSKFTILLRKWLMMRALQESAFFR